MTAIPRRRLTTVVAGALVLVVGLAACSGSDDTSADNTSPSEGSPVTIETSVEADEPDLPTAPLFDGADETVELLTATSGGGVRPLLEWSGVDGATWYTAILYAPDDSAYWSWSGKDTAIHVGGEPALEDDKPGPGVSPDMTWAVVALDDDAVPVAVSAPRPIAP